ncbi:MAG: hypothetical protein Q4G63_11340 [Bacteroidia bacterium]|nr:hypothetical protein [Bacteroidia bacterium]
MKVLFSPEVEDYLFELSETLYKKGYFGFKDSAVAYVRNLVLEIKNTLPISTKRPAPPYFERYRKNLYYASFRTNKNSQWYAFFPPISKITKQSTWFAISAIIT